jgi:hypothetical protein
MSRERALVINTWSSTCGACGKPADPHEKYHDTLLGYGPDNGEPGCGVKWEFVDTDYVGGGVAEAAKGMRPDLKPLPGGLIGWDCP